MRSQTLLALALLPLAAPLGPTTMRVSKATLVQAPVVVSSRTMLLSENDAVRFALTYASPFGANAAS